MQQKGPTQRQLRVGEEIKHLIVEVLHKGGFNNPALMDGTAITVSEVRVSPDLKHATAYVLTLGGHNMDKVLPALNDVAPVIQRDMGRKMKMKFTPRIKFVKDDTYDYASHIDKLLRS